MIHSIQVSIRVVFCVEFARRIWIKCSPRVRIKLSPEMGIEWSPRIEIELFPTIKLKSSEQILNKRFPPETSGVRIMSNRLS